jgi:hypothetical protein
MAAEANGRMVVLGMAESPSSGCAEFVFAQVVLMEGHYLPFVPLCNRNESVFLASCTPVVLPETRESVVQGATNIFTTIHSMDMKYLHIDKT